MHYTGFYPNATNAAQGISIVDGQVKQGLWAASDFFPNDGADFANPDLF